MRGEAVSAKGNASGFLFSPWIDLFFVINVCWPLILLVDRVGGVTTHQSLLFWQIYFVTAPHRWITLALVAVDHHKGHDRRRQFLALGSAILIGCLCVKMGTGSLLCLGAIDYIWNAWHFASQHHGVFQIYQRQSRPKRPDESILTSPAKLKVERIVFRGFMLYVIARVAGWGWSEGPLESFYWIGSVDWLVLVVPFGFVGRQIIRYSWKSEVTLASVAYLSSVMMLFTALLLASHFENNQWVVQLALASAIFHSLEYMAIVTWSMNRSRERSQSDVLTHLATVWLSFLAIFVLVIGIGNYLLSRGYFDFWVFVNLIVAFWHYCFDGMIWKSRKSKPSPATAVAS
ncbi:hypothetical protein [Aporhodopirellula aestuarii]|uniref:Uncharacterized protein n=1 Tax=Aporhodopirellula aestuarii TaxID=2950107 RepID=A0ABT0U9C8_9BACT|nr:hypothetical protein [Aporhodopirellula aestuarii]MCM2373579.1 hypothetical protein [Aporhodopirellula aestuarii]